MVLLHLYVVHSKYHWISFPSHTLFFPLTHPSPLPQVGAIPPKERVELFRHLPQSNRAALLSFLEEHFLEEEEGEGAASIHPAVYEV